MSYLSDSGASLALDLFCPSLFCPGASLALDLFCVSILATKTLLTTHLISDRKLDSRYLKRLVNIKGRFK